MLKFNISSITKTMKKQVALLMLMFLIFNSFGQNLSDQAAVLQKCIDLKEIQNYLPLDAEGTPDVIRIMQHAVTFPRDLAISKSGKQVEFLSKDQIYQDNSEAFFRFDKFELAGNLAEVCFDFHCNRNSLANSKIATIKLNLKKTGAAWMIETTKIDWR